MWVSHLRGSLGGDNMWVSCQGGVGCAASLLCRHINVIQNSDFLSFIVNLEYGPLRSRETLCVDCELYLLLIQWALTFIAAHHPSANPHNRPLPGIKGNSHTVTLSHNRYKRTIRMQARDPLSVAVVTSELVVESPEGAVVEDMTVQRVWYSTALWRNWRGVVTFIEICQQ